MPLPIGIAPRYDTGECGGVDTRLSHSACAGTAEFKRRAGTRANRDSTSYGQKTRIRLDSRGYDLTIAHPAACMLPTPSPILNAK